MGFSGMRGKVYVIDGACPIDLEKPLPPEGNKVRWVDQVVMFSTDESAFKREFGHDKSGGWQDICYGIRRMGISLDAIPAAQNPNPDLLGVGQVVWLELEPFGSCGAPAMGYAGLDRRVTTTRQENGTPVEYTMTLSSKGAWRNLPGGDRNWGGFECECADGESSVDTDGSNTGSEI